MTPIRLIAVEVEHYLSTPEALSGLDPP